MTTTNTTPRRAGGRAAEELRPVRIEIGHLKFAEGSALIEMGDTRVLAAASVENRVPPFLRDSGKGWATAEYAMLPRATPTRSTREVTRGRPSGRSSEIQRLIGRSLRAILDLTAMPDRTLTLDCDVLQADGGTRTAAITGAYVAAVQALGKLFLLGELPRWPVIDQVAAISVGIVENAPLLDLDAPEDQSADVDFNVIATAGGRLVELQGTGESRSFERAELDTMIDMALAGTARLAEVQREVLAPTLQEVESVLAKTDRKPAAPKSEKDLWGRP